MSSKYITVTGAREHNLKNINVQLPRDRLVVLTGLSGSGKSSLAFDTIYAEGQRRYVESLSSYARMFLGQMEKPDVDNIDGLSPAISIDQKTTSKNPRSTVGTVTEIYDYLRLLYARIGVPHCPVCGREIRQQTVDQIVDRVMEMPERTKIQVLAPVVRGRKGEKIKVHRKSEYGRGTYETEFEGIINNLERRFRDTSSSWIKEEIESYMSAVPSDACGGKRLSKESLAVTVGGKNISDFCDLSVVDALAFLDTLTLTPREEMIAAAVLKEIRSRLGFLRNVGLEYLTLSRAAATLSGGESQRIRLATNIGSSLMGVLYILDEPSIGLHQRDNHKLLSTLMRLRDLGNTVIVVEHDEDTMLAADHIVDIGPGAGIHGGNVIYSGDVQGILKCPESITGQYLSGQRFIPVPQTRREGNGKKITIVGAQQNNLKNVTVDIPLGKLVCITGVSGSGKSSLINEVLYKRLAGELNGARTVPGKHKEIRGMENLDKVIQINQSPIGRTPRSNPATYTGVFTDIRELYASTPEAKMHGFTSGRFSFNIKGGRCEACQGDGIIKIEMHFLPDVYVACDVCKGKRYNRETLEVKYKGKSIYDVLEMTVEEGLAFFKDHPKIARKLHTLCDVGLGYIKIGQPATTLSGGEAQRVKLATELSRRPTGKTVYILDEPTTGLHIADVHKLVEVLQKLVDGGNTVIVIEHNLDLIKTADHIIDLGPEGGDKGGMIIAEGTPEQVAATKGSYTGEYIKMMLERDKKRRAEQKA